MAWAMAVSRGVSAASCRGLKGAPDASWQAGGCVVPGRSTSFGRRLFLQPRRQMGKSTGVFLADLHWVAAQSGAARSNQLVAPLIFRPVNVAGDGEDVPPLLQGDRGRDQRAAAAAATSVPKVSPAIIRFRWGKYPGCPGAPGPYSLTAAPCSRIWRNKPLWLAG